MAAGWEIFSSDALAAKCCEKEGSLVVAVLATGGLSADCEVGEEGGMEVLQLDSRVKIRCQWCDVFLHSSALFSSTTSLLQTCLEVLGLLVLAILEGLVLSSVLLLPL